MTKKKARTRKDMVEALSPEEQEKALQEMTFPYPLAEAFDGQVVFDEMKRRNPRFLGSHRTDRVTDIFDLEDQVDNVEGHQKELLEKVSKKAAVEQILRLLEGGGEGNLPENMKMRSLIGSVDTPLAPSVRQREKMLKQVKGRK